MKKMKPKSLINLSGLLLAIYTFEDSIPSADGIEKSYSLSLPSQPAKGKSEVQPI
jgi:hypothetical protein